MMGADGNQVPQFLAFEAGPAVLESFPWGLLGPVNPPHPQQGNFP